VFQHLTSHCVSPHSSLCRDTALSAPASPPCCRWDPRSRGSALSACGCCGRVQLDHVVGISGALRKQRATTVCTVRHVPRCKSCPIISQTATEQTVLQVCWGILGDKGGSQLYCACRRRLDPNTDYPLFLSWVFLTIGTTLSAPVQSCCAN